MTLLTPSSWWRHSLSTQGTTGNSNSRVSRQSLSSSIERGKSSFRFGTSYSQVPFPWKSDSLSPSARASSSLSLTHVSRSKTTQSSTTGTSCRCLVGSHHQLNTMRRTSRNHLLYNHTGVLCQRSTLSSRKKSGPYRKSSMHLGSLAQWIVRILVSTWRFGDWSGARCLASGRPCRKRPSFRIRSNRTSCPLNKSNNQSLLSL